MQVFLTILGLGIGVVGLSVGFHQSKEAAKAKEVYRSHCRVKCRDVVDLTRSLSSEVVEACDVLWHEALAPGHETTWLETFLLARVNAIRVLTQRLASFCDCLNEEHRDQFDEPVFESLEAELPQRECLGGTGLVPVSGSLEGNGQAGG